MLTSCSALHCSIAQFLAHWVKVNFFHSPYIRITHPGTGRLTQQPYYPSYNFAPNGRHEQFFTRDLEETFPDAIYVYHDAKIGMPFIHQLVLNPVYQPKLVAMGLQVWTTRGFRGKQLGCFSRSVTCHVQHDRHHASVVSLVRGSMPAFGCKGLVWTLLHAPWRGWGDRLGGEVSFSRLEDEYRGGGNFARGEFRGENFAVKKGGEIFPWRNFGVAVPS